jgi:hypothetical protein
MWADQKSRASLKGIEASKAALHGHAIPTIPGHPGKTTCVNDKFCAISKYSHEGFLS